MAAAALTGRQMTLADRVLVDTNLSYPAVSASATGLVAYRAGTFGKRQLAWFDRSGKALGLLGAADENNLQFPSLSPDGERVVVSRSIEANQDLWVMDAARASRLTFDARGVDRNPVWSRDGRQIAFISSRAGQFDLYVKSASGSGTDELLLESAEIKVATDWSADGRFLLFYSVDRQTDRDIWVLPMTGDRKPWVFLKTPFNERNASFSPDGRWVAYQSDESGRFEVHIRPFTEPSAAKAGATAEGGQWQVSTDGGAFVRWRRDGKELYYINPDGAMMAVPITVTGSTLQPGAPVVLFPTRIYGGGVDTQQFWQYDVTSDGRFLINTVADEAAAPITLIQNWRPEGEK